MGMEFNEIPDMDRYIHHMKLFPMGEENQKRIQDYAVLIVGVGGLGSVSSTLLARAGVGRIGIVDKDVVSCSDLQRQILYASPDAGQKKVAVAKKRLNEINPQVSIEAYDDMLNEANADQILKNYSMVIDGSDNLETRYLINQNCAENDIPFIYGAVDRFDGQVSVFLKDNGPCYACLFPEDKTSTKTTQRPDVHVFSPLVLMVGALQANEALKIMAGMPAPLIGELLVVNTLEMRFEKIALSRRNECSVCNKQDQGVGPSL